MVTVCLMNVGISRAGSDVTAPTVTNVVVEKPNITKDEALLTVKMELKDDETGVAGVKLSFMGDFGEVGSPFEEYFVETDKPIYNGSFTYTCDIYSWASAQYHLRGIEVTDHAGNTRGYGLPVTFPISTLLSDEKGKYMPDSSDDSIRCYFKTSNVVKVERDSDEPNLLGVHLPKETAYQKGDTFYILLDVEDTARLGNVFILFSERYNGNVNFGILAQPPSTKAKVVWEKVDKDTVKVPVTIPGGKSSGDYVLSTIELGSGSSKHSYHGQTDEDGNDFVQYIYYKCKVEGGRTITVKTDGDEEYPEVKKVVIKTPSITKPGVIKIQAELADDTGIQSATCNIRRLEQTNNLLLAKTVTFQEKQKKRTALFEIPIGTNQVKGHYIIDHLSVIDFDGKQADWRASIYWADNNTVSIMSNEKGSILAFISPKDSAERIAYIQPQNSVSVDDEIDVAFEVGLSNPNLSKKLEGLKEGEAAMVALTGNDYTAPKELFEAIRGKNKTIIFYRSYFQWWFNGKDIKNPKDINLDIGISLVDGEDYGSEVNLPKFSFGNNGELPGKAQVRIKSDYVYTLYGLSHTLYLYYMDQNADQLSLEDKSNIKYYLDDTDHWCSFEIAHNSAYLASGKKIGKTKTKVGDSFTKKKLKYKITAKGEVAFTGLTKNGKKLVIPDTVKYREKSYKVIKIANASCKNRKSLKALTIGKNVKVIGKKAFYCCKKLKKITIKTPQLSSKTVGKKAFGKTPKKMTVKVPKKKKKTYRKLLRKKGVSKKAKIK